MRINIVAPDNGVGLSRDRKIIAEALHESGHELNVCSADGMKAGFDVSIFCEVVYPDKMRFSKRNYLIPNPEWFFKQWTGTLNRFDSILCKTRDAERIFRFLGARTKYIGFTSIDMYDQNIIRRNQFIHVAGKSDNKGTEQVIEAASKTGYPTIIVTQTESHKMNRRSTNVQLLFGRIEEKNLRRLMNESRFHLCPSRCEGFGHYINEARSVGGIVVTTNVAPMNELVTRELGYGVRVISSSKQNLGTRVVPDVESIAECMNSCMRLQADEVQELSERNRSAYLSDKGIFFANLIDVLEL